MRIEAVTVCVDYADFLEVTLPSLRAAVDELLVVTSLDDHRTAALCHANEVAYIATEAMHADGRKFSLGAGIDMGLKAQKPDDWILVVDADIVLPPHFHRTLDRLRLDPAKIYGIDRVHCRGFAAAATFSTTPRNARAVEVPHLRDFPIGARMAPEGLGYMPCGYFQLWNARATGYRDYPIDPGGTAAQSDMMHASRFPRAYRELIPELVAIELGTDEPDDPVGVNWSGRRTPEFSIEGGPYRR